MASCCQSCLPHRAGFATLCCVFRPVTVGLLGLLMVILLEPVAFSQIIITNTDYTLHIHENERVVNMVLETSEYTNWAYGNQTYADRANMTRRLYDHFEDSFDMILLVNNEDVLLSPAYGTHYPVKNDISGLGKSFFDNTANYSSTGTLQSLIHLGVKNGLSGGPSLHEMAHRWAHSITSSIPTAVKGHWGYSGVGGQLGGWQAETFTNMGGGVYDADGPSGGTSWGSFANGGNGIPYADLELYLMGLIPAAGVTNDIRIAQGFAWSNSSLGQFTATNILAVTIGDITTTEGARTAQDG